MDLLTVREAAKRLHVSLPTIRRLIAGKALPVVVLQQHRRKRLLRVRPETLERLVRRRETGRHVIGKP